MTVVLLFFMTFAGSVAALFLKRASGAKSIIALLANYNLYAGGLLYAFAASLNILVLRELDYSLVLPLTSLTYIWTAIISRIVLKERITVKKIIGLSFIVLGTLVLSFSFVTF